MSGSSMDFVNKLAGGGPGSGDTSSGSSGGLMDKMNSMAGGGQSSEKNEDYLDKGECLACFHA